MKHKISLISPILGALVIGLLASLPARAATFTWDATNTVTGVQDGIGTWDTTVTNWWDSAGLTNLVWNNANNDTASFGSGSGAGNFTVTVGAPITVGGITFNAGSPNYTISGNTITLAGATPTITANNNATITSILTGSAGLVKDGASVLTLTGANNYTGGTTINAGTLRLGNGAVNGTIGSGLYTITSSATMYLNYATAIGAGTGLWSSRIRGAGTLELNSAQAVNGTANWGPNSAGATSFDAGFTGTLRVDNGRIDSSAAGLGGISSLIIQSNAQFLAWSGTYTMPIAIAGNGWGESGQPGALRMAGSNNGTWAGSVTLSADAGILAQAGSTFTFTGPITGSFQNELNAQSTATLHLAPAAAVQNSYGSTKITGAGAVVAGNQYAFSTGALLMNGGTLKINGFPFTFANLSGTSGTIGNYHASNPATITVGTDNASTTYGGTLVNGGAAALSLVKAGTGLLTLAGLNTYTGGTTISAGTLKLDLTGRSNDIQFNFGTFSVGSSGTLELFTSVGLNYGTQAVLPINTTFTGSGTITKTGTGIVDFFTGTTIAAFTGLVDVQAGILADQSGGWTTGSVSLNVAGGAYFDLRTSDVAVNNLTGSGTIASSYQTHTFTVGKQNGSSTFSGVIQNAVPTSSGGSANGQIIYLTKAGTGTLVLTGTNTFTGTTTINAGTLTIGGVGLLGNGAYPGNIVVSSNLVYASAANQTFSGVISGAGALIQNGPGTLVLTGNNSFTGSTTVNAGTLKLNLSSRPIGPTALNLGTLSVGANGVLELFTTSGSIGNPDLFSTGTTLTGSGTVTKTGAGYVDFWVGSSIKNFSGYLDVQAGFLSSQADWSTSGGTMTLNVGPAGTVDLRTDGIVVNKLTGTGTIGSSYTAGMVLTVGAQNGSSTFDGVIQNTVPGFANAPTVALAKNGTGTFTLTGNNTFTGGTTLNGGLLFLGGATGTALGNGNLTIAAGANGYQYGVYLLTDQTSGLINFNASGYNYVRPNGHTWTVAGLVDSSGKGVVENGGYTKGVSSSGTMVLNVTGANSYSYNGYFRDFDAGGGPGLLNVVKTGTGTQTIYGDLPNYTGSTTVSNGVLRLQTTRNWASAVTVANGATVELNSSGFPAYNFTRAISGDGALLKAGTDTIALTAASTYTGGTFITAGTLRIGGTDRLPTAGTVTIGASAATFDVNGQSQTIAALVGSNGGSITLGSGTLTVSQSAATVSTFNGTISGPGGQLILSGGTLTLTGDNTYTGTTLISAGALQLGNGTPSGSVAGSISNNAALIFNRSDAFTHAGGPISGSGSVTIAGGTLNITNVNTYSGGTYVNGGTLLVNEPTGNATGSGLVTVNLSGTLGGTGLVTEVEVVDGTLAPGNSVGTLTVGDLTLIGSAHLFYELGATNASDTVMVTGNLTLSGYLDISMGEGFGAGQYTLFTYTPGLLTDNGLVLGTGYDTYNFNNVINTSQPGVVLLDVTAIVIPEPETLALVAGSLLCLLVLRRRRS